MNHTAFIPGFGEFFFAIAFNCLLPFYFIHFDDGRISTRHFFALPLDVVVVDVVAAYFTGIFIRQVKDDDDG